VSLPPLSSHSSIDTALLIFVLHHNNPRFHYIMLQILISFQLQLDHLFKMSITSCSAFFCMHYTLIFLACDAIMVTGATSRRTAHQVCICEMCV
jgi:hypothetical protein